MLVGSGYLNVMLVGGVTIEFLSVLAVSLRAGAVEACEIYIGGWVG